MGDGPGGGCNKHLEWCDRRHGISFPACDSCFGANVYAASLASRRGELQTTTKGAVPFVVVWAFVQIKPAKNLSLGGWRCLRIRVVKWHSRTWLLVDYGKLYFQIMACAALVVGDAPHVRRYGASRHRQPLQRVASGQSRRKTSANSRREGSRAPFAAVFCLSGASQMQVSRLFWVCRAHRDKCSIKPQVSAVSILGVLGLLQIVYSLRFFC